MGLKIPCLFVLCFFWHLWVVFKRFPTNVGVRNTSFNGELQSPIAHVPSAAGTWKENLV